MKASSWLLVMVRAINKLSISTKTDLGEGSHCVHGEPYYRQGLICSHEKAETSIVSHQHKVVFFNM